MDNLKFEVISISEEAPPKDYEGWVVGFVPDEGFQYGRYLNKIFISRIDFKEKEITHWLKKK
jgi:hypothetical protein